ncbi:hypothetical protein K3148_10770 [Qipengyuania aurantiaca]|uniref:Uncharacterized protein n=1 Tax=Qipengyuania aurantiaca TaxID=2867233 RepID=A0ABX8ZK10_9SPHN|nr:hypothetical protein [Qipengyuania aurantiaca]QZD89297.1 hypothetical protein K3148_10770 [Qipengyuania aurantiaca]
MRSPLPLLLASAALAACVTAPPPLPSYRYAGIDLGATIKGKVDLIDRCLIIEPVLDGQRQPLVHLIMPLGTRLSGDTIILPSENGGARIDLGTVARFQGGYNTIDEMITWARNPGKCRGDAFIVNRTYP